MVGRSDRQIMLCIASIKAQLFDKRCPISTISEGSRLFGSVVTALDFYRGGPGSNPIRDVGFFQTMRHFLFTNFHIHKSMQTVAYHSSYNLYVCNVL